MACGLGAGCTSVTGLGKWNRIPGLVVRDVEACANLSSPGALVPAAASSLALSASTLAAACCEESFQAAVCGLDASWLVSTGESCPRAEDAAPATGDGCSCAASSSLSISASSASDGAANGEDPCDMRARHE